MIEEPYRWVEAIGNRRDYIEHQLARGSPIVGLSFADGILFLTLGRERQKLFEIYNRIVMGAIGHPADIEKLRMAAIELASTEGFTRSAADVSLRRLANYSLSPALKAAFEQIYGPPYLVRLILAELGNQKEPNLLIRLDYDGSMHTNGGSLHRSLEDFAVVAGTQVASKAMEEFLRKKKLPTMGMAEALDTAINAWIIGQIATEENEHATAETISHERKEHLSKSVVEAALLDRHSANTAKFRNLSQKEIQMLIQSA